MSGSTKYPPGGVLFPNARKTSDKHPDYTGNLEITEEVLRDLIAQAKAGKTPKMDLSGWKKQSGKGPFVSMVAKKAWVKPESTGTYDDDSIPF
jgi:hypothetical protein